VVIVGGGLAGLSCAFDLAEQGFTPLVLEANPWTGGRTASWTDPDGMRVESGLHRVVGVYTALPALLSRAGIDPDAAIIWEDQVEFRQPIPGPSAVFSAAPKKRPMDVVADVLGHNEYVSPAAKLSFAAIIASGLADYSADPAQLDEKSILEYAVENNAHPQVISRVLEPLVAGIYFVPASQFSAYAFMALIAPYLPNAFRFRVGAFAGGMTEVMTDPLAEAIRRRGGEVLTGRRVDELLLEDHAVTGVRVGEEIIPARHVVLASSICATKDLLRPHFEASAWCEPLFRLPTMPAVTLQLELDQPSMPLDRTTFGVGTSLACFSEQSRTTFRETAGRLSIIMAPSDKLLGLSPEKILEIALDDADRLGLRVRGHVKRFRVVAHHDDFYSLAPRNDHLRPGQATPVSGLSLAGDYTRQPFVATMEGAVVSGQLAAQVVRAELSNAALN
jgi:15-cis-phytoene desaturase